MPFLSLCFLFLHFLKFFQIFVFPPELEHVFLIEPFFHSNPKTWSFFTIPFDFDHWGKNDVIYQQPSSWFHIPSLFFLRQVSYRGENFGFPEVSSLSDAHLSWLKWVEATHGKTWKCWGIYNIIKLLKAGIYFDMDLFFNFFGY